MVSVAAMDPRQSDDLDASIRIRLFAGLREEAGWSERVWPAAAAGVNNPLTPGRLWSALHLPGDPGSVRVAINQQFASLDDPLLPGDELAFLPPISGG
jgi:molybdopterin synthase sulfur carrier subunit